MWCGCGSSLEFDGNDGRGFRELVIIAMFEDGRHSRSIFFPVLIFLPPFSSPPFPFLFSLYLTPFLSIHIFTIPILLSSSTLYFSFLNILHFSFFNLNQFNHLSSFYYSSYTKGALFFSARRLLERYCKIVLSKSIRMVNSTD